MSRTSQPLERLAGCVKAMLDEKAIEVCGVYLTTGQGVAIDQPPGKSMAWVRLVDITPPPAAEASAGVQCTSELVMSVEVGIAHCWVLKEDPLTVDEHLKHQVEVDASMWALYKAIACCPDWMPTGRRGVIPIRWQPIGPQGGIVGGAWLLTVGV